MMNKDDRIKHIIVPIVTAIIGGILGANYDKEIVNSNSYNNISITITYINAEDTDKIINSLGKEFKAVYGDWGKWSEWSTDKTKNTQLTQVKTKTTTNTITGAKTQYYSFRKRPIELVVY